MAAEKSVPDAEAMVRRTYEPEMVKSRLRRLEIEFAGWERSHASTTLRGIHGALVDTGLTVVDVHESVAAEWLVDASSMEDPERRVVEESYDANANKLVPWRVIHRTEYVLYPRDAPRALWAWFAREVERRIAQAGAVLDDQAMALDPEVAIVSGAVRIIWCAPCAPDEGDEG